MRQTPPTFLSYAFRPFFLLNGFFAVLVVLAWVMSLHGVGGLDLTPLWHSHEMLLGFAMATVAGFSLTAVAQWTGRPAVNGAPLAWLVFCWLAGRLAMVLSGWLPAGLVMAVDLLFPLLLCILLSREIIAARNRRNYPLVVITVVLVLLNGLYHLDTPTLPHGDRLAIYLLIHTILLLVTIIGGRIVPAFTANWMRQQGRQRLPVISVLVDRTTLILTAMTGVTASFLPQHPATGVLALAAALAHGLRLSRWRGLATLANPLLLVLHVAYAWLPVGYVLLGASVFGWLVAPTAALHALTMGAIGSMVLAVTTRVALGHTGRPLQAARATVAAYWILLLAVLMRVLGPLTGAGYLLMIDLAAAGWMLAFAIFVWVYWPILSRPRVDR